MGTEIRRFFSSRVRDSSLSCVCDVVRSDGPDPFWTGTEKFSQSDLKVVGVGIVDQASADEYEMYPILRMYANGSDNHNLACRSDGYQSEAYSLLYRAGVDDNPLEPEFASFESWKSGAPIGKSMCMFHFSLSNVSLYPKPNCDTSERCPTTGKFERRKTAKNVLHFVDTNDAARSLTYDVDDDRWIYRHEDSPKLDIKHCRCTRVQIDSGTWTLSRRTSKDVIVEGDPIPINTKGRLEPVENTIRGVLLSLPDQVEIVHEQVYGNPDGWRFKASSAFVEAPYIAEMNRSSHSTPPDNRMVDVRWITPADRPHVTNYSLHWRTDLGIGSRLPSILRSDKKNPEQYDLVYHVSAGWYQAVPHIDFVKNCTLVDETESVCVFYWNEVDASNQNVIILEQEHNHRMEVLVTLNFDGFGKFNYTLSDSYVPSDPLPPEKIKHMKKLSDYMDAISQPFVNAEKKQFILKSCPNSVFIKKGEKFEPRYYKLVLPLGNFPTNNTILAQICPECVGITNGRKCLPDIVGDQRKQYLPREPYSYLEWNNTHWNHYIRRFCIASNYGKPGYSTGEFGDYALAFVAPSANGSDSSYQQIMNAKWQKLPMRGDGNITNQVWPNPGRRGIYLPSFVSEPGNKVFCEVFVNFANELQEKTEELIKWVLSFMVLEGTCLVVFIFVYMKKHRRRCWH
eukprot:GEMP01011211.1.p1 GENE.GEMP01011211.1~~GEMP01011211.1.p1  ORF type:complete len:681 (+),score=87.20 GEMP01011211.1:674-2716(+)